MKKFILIGFAFAITLSALLGQGGAFRQGGAFTQSLPETGGTITGNLNINKRLIIGDSLRVAKTSIFTGAQTYNGRADFNKRVDVDSLYIGGVLYVGFGAYWDSVKVKTELGKKVDTTVYKTGIGAKADTVDLLYLEDSLAAYPDTLVTNSIWDSLGAYPDTLDTVKVAREVRGTDCVVSDSVTGKYGVYSGSFFTGNNAAGFWNFNTYDAIIGKGADSSGIGINADSLLINNAGNCANVSVKGNLVASYADIDTVVNTGWLSSPYADIDTVMINGLSFKGFIVNGAKDSVWLLLNADTLLIMP